MTAIQKGLQFNNTSSLQLLYGCRPYGSCNDASCLVLDFAHFVHIGLGCSAPCCSRTGLDFEQFSCFMHVTCLRLRAVFMFHSYGHVAFRGPFPHNSQLFQSVILREIIFPFLRFSLPWFVTLMYDVYTLTNILKGKTDWKRQTGIKGRMF